MGLENNCYHGSEYYIQIYKIGGGLSVPIQVKRRIRQGCPMSGQLYALAIEPLLCLLRNKLSGILVSEKPEAEAIKLSAYADDITLIVRNKHDIQGLKEALKIYEGASSAKLNWKKKQRHYGMAMKEALYLNSQKMLSGGSQVLHS